MKINKFKYENYPHFTKLVDVLQDGLDNNLFTISDLMDASNLAILFHEERKRLEQANSLERQKDAVQ